MRDPEEILRLMRNLLIAIVAVIITLFVLFLAMLAVDRKYPNTTEKYVMKEGILSSTAFMMENEKPYAVSFEEIDPVYVPEELEETAKAFISEYIEKENSEYPQVTCRLLETTKTFIVQPKETTYRIIEMKTTE